MLRTGTAAQVVKEIQKLHLRWWHAGRSQMEKVLSAAGVPPEIVGVVPKIIDTCQQCRAWKAPAPEVTPTIELTVKQNEFVKPDIMFYKQSMISS